MLKPPKIAILVPSLLAVALLPCLGVAASTLHPGRLPSGTSQIKIAQAGSGLVFSNISFVQTSKAQKEIRGWALKIQGTLTNRSSNAIQARAITYNIIAFNGQQSEVVVNNSEFLSPSMEPVTLAPGQSIAFTHSLDSEQMASLSRYMLAPDIFRFQVTGVTEEVIGKLPVRD